MKLSWLIACVALVASAAVGCASKPYEPTTPDGFVELTDGARTYDSSAYEYRASTADGVVLGVRAYKNEPKVGLTVAVQALESRVRQGEGYALLGKKDITLGDGTKGVALDFGHDEANNPHLYKVCVFVTQEHVYIVEAGGKKELVEKEKAAIDSFIASLKTS